MNTKPMTTGHEPKPDFRSQLQHLINCHSKENGSDTPDFILAEYLEDCLAAFDKAAIRRSLWYKPSPIVNPTQPPRDNWYPPDDLPPRNQPMHGGAC